MLNLRLSAAEFSEVLWRLNVLLYLSEYGCGRWCWWRWWWLV